MTGSATPAPTLVIPPAPGSSDRVAAVPRRCGGSHPAAHWGHVRLLDRMLSRDPGRVAPAVVAEVEVLRRAPNPIGVAAPLSRPRPGRERASRAEDPIAIGQSPQSWEGPSPSEHPEGSRERCWS